MPNTFILSMSTVAITGLVLRCPACSNCFIVNRVERKTDAKEKDNMSKQEVDVIIKCSTCY